MLDFIIKKHDTYHFEQIFLENKKTKSADVFGTITQNFTKNGLIVLSRFERSENSLLGKTQAVGKPFEKIMERSNALCNVEQKIENIKYTYIQLLNEYQCISHDCFNKYKDKNIKYKLPLNDVKKDNSRDYLCDFKVVDKSGERIEFIVDNHVEIYENPVPHSLLVYSHLNKSVFEALIIRLHLFGEKIEFIISDEPGYRYGELKDSEITCYSSEKELYSKLEIKIMLKKYTDYRKKIDSSVSLDSFMEKFDNYQEIEKMWSI